jgi:hypothetical protein
MKKIKEVPSKLLNYALDGWIARSMGELGHNCNYCTLGRCWECPLSDVKREDYSIFDIDKMCCNGLFLKWLTIVEPFGFPVPSHYKLKKAKAAADKIVDFILSRCVY